MSVTLRAGDSLLDSLSLSILVAARTVVCDEWTGGPERRDPFARLYVVMSGSGRITVRGRDWILGAGAVVLVPSDTPVVLHRARGLDHFWTHFTARVAAGLSLFSVFEPPVLIESGSDDARREATLVQAIVERGLGDPASRFAAHTRLRLLLEPFIERGRWSDRTEQLARFYPAIEYIAEHLAEPIRTSDIAETVNLHPTYFANRFASATGVAPREYLRARRIEAAQMMLLHTDLPVKSIAVNTGFRESAYFCRAFRNATGLAPGGYRARGVV